ncbi:serine hydrolase domain-containing protein [Anaerocolumna xylanovorans]|uniref:CubicO group peptidase, beta-lactamase class C family n=1 Tax=Anaerocolumna xylanovorans DSM 12503 TaxID=1121345 RepID=A0A1M7YN40_9FIRM|nr:serine hydrolase [Anaerocolumna xylanovorans]SHO54063.1 CubicO group peptidase, beta-lactamase class C family [Anaerocolumna xylanovorans DSM 12503]
MFENFIQKVKENNWPVYGIEVFYQGLVVNKYDFVPENRHPIYSATKVFTSTAAGIAAEEGKFSIDASLYDYLKEEIPTDVTHEQLETLRKISIKRLLTMSVPGYPFRPEGNNWLDFSLTFPIQYSNTPVFDYSNIPAYLAGAAVEKAVGEHLIKYLDTRLFKPLGIENPEYMNCPSGHFYGASGISLTVNELSRLGQLYLQNGQYNNKQILSESWVKEATAIQQMNREGGYGYYFWKYKDGYSINGKWGQKCYVFPEQQLMITYLADLEKGSDAIRLTMEQEILPGYGI